MTDDEKLLKALAPKSDQINSDDLIGRSLTIKITKIIVKDSDQQPIEIFYEGDNGKPYRPCKSMGRVLRHCWSNQPRAWVGRSITLYRDAGVTWGGLAVGGIRISHVSDIDAPMEMSLTASKSVRKTFTVKPLVIQAAPQDDTEAKALHAVGVDKVAEGLRSLELWWKSLTPKQQGKVKAYLPAWKEKAAAKPAEGHDWSNGDPEPDGLVELIGPVMDDTFLGDR